MLANTAEGILSVPELEVYESISKNYSLESARERAMELLKKNALSLGAGEEDIERK